MNVFHHLVVVALFVAATTNFVWFALTYFVYLETQSVISTGAAAGIYLVIVVLSGFWFGSFVDRNLKKHAMIISSLATLAFFRRWLICLPVRPVRCFYLGYQSLPLVFCPASAQRRHSRPNLFHSNPHPNYTTYPRKSARQSKRIIQHCHRNLVWN